jgi:hypothetical protein
MYDITAMISQNYDIIYTMSHTQTVCIYVQVLYSMHICIVDHEYDIVHSDCDIMNTDL